MDSPTCPFCDQVISTTGVHPSNLSDCPLDGYAFDIAKWNMRPPKKEQPSEKSAMDLLVFHLAGEVQWLRERLEILMAPEEPEQRYSIDLGYERKEPEEAGK